ncbi:MAG TPA: cell division protein FtsZ [Methylibium sp.]|uniref:cell division protein FtsZ n=1 Tax=Methylibium sp. TaxID=2067992 RepID=UPI002DBCF103|nr:cell division protein FtsZ [Methylibium sp.]HEU4460633.1 cell division protein FtsZ [Methylibium sp.]
MTSLQAGLAILGALLLAGLGAHTAWRLRGTKPRAEPAAPLQAGRVEPGELVEPQLGPMAPMDGEGVVAEVLRAEADAPPAEAGAPERIEPAFVAPPRPLVRTAPALDALLDAIAQLTIEQPIAGEAAIAHLPATRRAGNKPLLIEGLDTETGTWETLQPGRRYGEFQAGVQLANRAGALNEIEYSEFVQKVQAFADGLGAAVDFPDMLDAVARARELDAFAADHDAQLVMRLACGRAAWTLGYVQQHAQRHGFVPGVLPGRLVLPAADTGAPPVLLLQFDAQAALAEEPQNAPLRELRLVFDAPQTARDEQPFVAWCAAGEALSLALDASLLDDRGQALNTAAFESIGKELERLYTALAERDLAAGSPAARRLFS